MSRQKRCEIKSKSATPSVAKASKQASIYGMNVISASTVIAFPLADSFRI